MIVNTAMPAHTAKQSYTDMPAHTAKQSYTAMPAHNAKQSYTAMPMLRIRYETKCTYENMAESD